MIARHPREDTAMARTKPPTRSAPARSAPARRAAAREGAPPMTLEEAMGALEKAGSAQTRKT